MSEASTLALLRAARMCGLDTPGASAHRVHLFYVARHKLGSTARRGELQNTLQRGTRSGDWARAEGKGRYALTAQGRAAALHVAPDVAAPTYPPQSNDHVRFEIRFPKIGGHSLWMRWEHTRFHVFLDEEPISPDTGYTWLAAQRAPGTRRALREAMQNRRQAASDRPHPNESWRCRWCSPKSPALNHRMPLQTRQPA